MNMIFESVPGWQQLTAKEKASIRSIIEDRTIKEKTGNMAENDDYEYCMDNCDYMYTQRMERCATLPDGSRAVCEFAAQAEKEKCHSSCRVAH
jgi:hypothetical protein